MTSILMVNNGNFITMGGDKQRTGNEGEITRNDVEKVFKINEHLIIGLAGLGKLTDFTKKTIKVYFEDQKITNHEIKKLILHLDSKISKKIAKLKIKYNSVEDLKKIQTEGVCIYIGFRDENTFDCHLKEIIYRDGASKKIADIKECCVITRGEDIAKTHLNKIKGELNIINSKKWIEDSIEEISRDPKNNTGSACDILTI